MSVRYANRPTSKYRLHLYRIWCRRLSISCAGLADCLFPACSVISRQWTAASCRISRTGWYRLPKGSRIVGMHLTTDKRRLYWEGHDVLDMHHCQVEILDVADCRSCKRQFVRNIRVGGLNSTQQHVRTQDLDGYHRWDVETISHRGKDLHQ